MLQAWDTILGDVKHHWNVFAIGERGGREGRRRGTQCAVCNFRQKKPSYFSFPLSLRTSINAPYLLNSYDLSCLPDILHLDLKNEPHGLATWGTGDESTDWNTAAEKIGAHLLGGYTN